MSRPMRTDLTAKYNEMWEESKPMLREHAVPTHALTTLGTRQSNRTRLQRPDAAPFGAATGQSQISATAFSPAARSVAIVASDVPSECRTDDASVPLSCVAEFEFADSSSLDAFAAALSAEFTGAPVGPLSFVLYRKRRNVLAWSSSWYNCDWVRVAQWYSANARLVRGERQAVNIMWTILGQVTSETKSSMDVWTASSPRMRVSYAPLIAGFVVRT